MDYRAVLANIYKDVKDIKQFLLNNGNSTDSRTLLKVVSNYPVPDVTPRQIYLMLSNKVDNMGNKIRDAYPVEYVMAVTGLDREDVIKKYNSHANKNT